MFPLNSVSHRRLNALTGEWVVVSPHRTARPWQGQIDPVSSEKLPPYDPSCYLCPGNRRAEGSCNPQYSSTFVFDNDFPALQADIPPDLQAKNTKDLVVALPERGICRVGCFSPRHDLTLAAMSITEIESVVEMWIDQFRSLTSINFIQYVQIFENRGAMMGASNPHPHCQIWGTGSVPTEVAKEQCSQANYLRSHSSCLLCDYAQYEEAQAERLVFADEHFMIVVPFWAVWPFETLVISKRHIADLGHLAQVERCSLARILHTLTRSYDEVFKSPFPYSMGFHQQPSQGETSPEWHLHAHFYPPLLRSASIRKFMVGFEMLGTPQRDITPEFVAARLRELCAGTTKSG
ncbi:MAG: UDP-glucose--hexose-1-phosphate uridylyltransferase [Acidobacteriaceae bacterium]|nr:UDP-glucose--hexose-1-phosphate uridylyltransferase [Acidobacteriaceae bacterium]